ncbi:MAG: T9SS type A sorting domain-containing protein [Candidatus Eisenbacteria bacterium]
MRSPGGGSRRWMVAIALLTLFGATPAAAARRFDAPLLTQLSGGMPTPANPVRAAVGDVAGDRVPDVFAPGPLGNPVMLYGVEDGTLSAPVPVTNLQSIGGSWCAMGDFDGDGATDLVSSWYAPVWADFGDGTGHHWDPRYTGTSFSMGIACADFDRDGRDDIATFGSDGTIHVLFGRADRDFDDVLTAPVVIGAKAVVMEVADLNRDGIPDLVVLPANQAFVVAYLSRGDRTFDVAPHFSGFISDLRDMAVGDVTGDGIPDLVAYETLRFDLMPGLGDGTFGPTQVIMNAPGGYGGIALGDVTGDGRLDLVIAQTGGPVLTLAGHGDGTFSTPIPSPIDASLRSLTLADFDGDERMDLFSFDETDLGVRVALGDGSGHFGGRATDIALAAPAWAVLGADLDGDGATDLITIGWTGPGSQLQVAMGRPGRAFQVLPPRPLASTPSLDSFLPGAWDLDEDGYLDLVLLRGSTTLGLLHGNGDGTFGPEQDLAAPYRGLVECLDVNGDGHLDLVVPATDSIRVFLGQGAAGFGPPIATRTSLPNLFFSAAGDLDGDGHPDLELLDDQVGDVSERGLGDGRFIQRSVTAVANPRAVSIADLDGDGRMDRIVESAGSTYGLMTGSISVQLQQPNGTLGAAVVTARPDAEGSGVWFGDIDGDGRTDRMALEASTVNVWRGDGAGGFALESGYGGLGAYGFAHGDFDHDGRLDIAFGSDPLGARVAYGRDVVAPTLTLIQPQSGTPLVLGTTIPVLWSASDVQGVTGIDLFVSRHGPGGPFSPVALGLPNTGETDWAVGDTLCDSVVVKLVARDPAGNVRHVTNNGVLHVVAPTQVGAARPPLRLAIAAVTPNPVRGRAELRIEMPQTGHVRLDLFDLQGRLVATLLDSDRPAGVFPLTFDAGAPGRSLAAGLYLARISCGGQTATKRLVVTR